MWVNNEREGKIESPRHTNVEWAHDERQSQRKHNRQPTRSGTRPVIPADAKDRPALVPDPWPVLDLRRASTEPPAPFDFVVPGLMAGTVGALVSPGGTGKSMWALQMALSLSAGVDMLGLGSGVSSGQPVVFLSAEDQMPNRRQSTPPIRSPVIRQDQLFCPDGVLIRSLKLHDS